VGGAELADPVGDREQRSAVLRGEFYGQAGVTVVVIGGDNDGAGAAL